MKSCGSKTHYKVDLAKKIVAMSNIKLVEGIAQQEFQWSKSTPSPLVPIFEPHWASNSSGYLVPIIEPITFPKCQETLAIEMFQDAMCEKMKKIEKGQPLLPRKISRTKRFRLDTTAFLQWFSIHFVTFPRYFGGDFTILKRGVPRLRVDALASERASRRAFRYNFPGVPGWG